MNEKLFAKVQENNRMNLAKRLAEREQTIIGKLVMAYRSGKLSSEMLFGGIAAISELRAIITEAEQNAMQATDEVQSFMKE